MKIELDDAFVHQYQIKAYDKGLIYVGNEQLSTSFIVTSSSLIKNWEPQTFAELKVNHFDKILRLSPELLLLGTGRKQHFPTLELIAKISASATGFEVMDTGAACRCYNALLQEGRRVAAALLIIE